MAESKTPMLDAFEQWARDGWVEEDYIKDVYLTENDGCIPDQYIGDDVMKDIRRKFALPLSFIIDKVEDELGERRAGLGMYPLIDPDYEDCTTYTIVATNQKTGKRDFLYYNSQKAWHFWFETREEFEKELMDIYIEVHKNLTQLDIVAGTGRKGSEVIL